MQKYDEILSASLFTFLNLFLNPLNMTAAQGFYLAVQFKVTPDLVIRKYPEAIDHSNRSASPFDDIVR